jgi:hypothetical protein
LRLQDAHGHASAKFERGGLRGEGRRIAAGVIRTTPLPLKQLGNRATSWSRKACGGLPAGSLAKR